MAEVQWIKLYTDLGSNKKIKRIRKLPEGNNIVLIWCLLLLQAGESNKQGGLFLTDTMPFTPEDLAIELDFDVDVIKFALMSLEKYQMLQVYEDVIYIKNWDEYQNVDGMEKIKEQTRNRVAKHREKQKALAQSNVTCNATVTQSNETEVEVEVDLDLEIDLEKEVKSSSRPLPKTPEIIYQENIGMLTAHIAERINVLISDGVTDELLSKYITVAVERGKRNWSYIEKMALGNLEDGITTLIQYEAMKKERISSTKPKTNENSNPFAKYRKEKGWV